MSQGIHELELISPVSALYRERILTPDALQFLRELEENFGETRRSLLQKRQERQEMLRAGGSLDFLSSTRWIRESDWTVAPAPSDLTCRLVEITGPTDAKMLINALNSGADGFMADLEDALAPSWHNVLQGQWNLQEAVRKTLSFQNEEGKLYHLKPQAELATLLVRPRGWHLEEKNVRWQGRAISASLFDFGLYFFHNARASLEQGSGPYFYLPKMESHLEARLWNEVFLFSQARLGISRGSIRATCLIETVPAAFEMDEILYELREHASGLNAGRWDYIFSMIKKFSDSSDQVLPDRAQITMSVPFMKAYSEHLVQVCHRRNAHAMGGMAAFIPSRKDAAVNERALQKVIEDKRLEVQKGFDGTWVAHPDLVPIARSAFRNVLGEAPHQKHILRTDVTVDAASLLDVKIPGSCITEDGVRHNIRVAIQYMNCWLNGLGAVALDHLMEDAATAEISRAQLWQWVHHTVTLSSGRTMTAELYLQFRKEELARLGGMEKERHKDVIELLDGLVLAPDFCEFLTLPAYRLLDRPI